MHIVDTDGRQVMRSKKRNAAGDHENQTENRQFLAHVQEWLALLGAPQMTGITNRADNERHEQSMQSCVENNMAENCAQGLHARIDCLLKTKCCACFHS